MTGVRQYYRKDELGAAAQSLATYGTVRGLHPESYIPIDFETREYSPTPEPERRAWKLMDRAFYVAYSMGQDRMFYGQDEKNFRETVWQASQPEQKPAGLLIRTSDGLRLLKQGKLIVPTGEFAPNLLPVQLNSEQAAKDELFRIICDWVDGEEQAISLLRHVSMALHPDWTAVRRVLLVGNGRNGKGVFMSMLQAALGDENCSQVTRKQMDDDTQAPLAFGDALANIVFDAQAETIKDTSTEKTILAGERIAVRPNHARYQVQVSTNAMHIEGLNDEPRTWDKSFAMDARHVRFDFPNTYKLDPVFSERMNSEEMVGAFLALMIDHLVQRQDAAAMLMATAKSDEMARQHKLANDLGARFIFELFQAGAMDMEMLQTIGYKTLCDRFINWRRANGDSANWDNYQARRVLKHVVRVDEKRRMIPDDSGGLVKQAPVLGLTHDMELLLMDELSSFESTIISEMED